MKASGNNDVVVCAENLFRCEQGECFLVRDKGLPGTALDRREMDQTLLVFEAQKQLKRFEHPSRVKDYMIVTDRKGTLSIELGVYDG